MNYIGISKSDKRFKGNLHSHTINSDGHLTPLEAKKMYKENGYSFIAFTDHDIYTDYRDELNDDEFIILPGVEASSFLISNLDNPCCKKTHHMIGILGTSSMQAKATKPIFSNMEKLTQPIRIRNWDGDKAAQELADSLKERGMIVTYNHPLWSRVSYNEFSNIEGISCIEIFNYNTENECGLGYDTVYWDKMLCEGKRVNCFASDDNHNQGIFPDSLGGAIVVCANELSHDDIIENIVKGNYYSTSGVEIMQWGIRDDVVYVECSDVNRINFIVGGNVGDGITIMCNDIDDTINSAEYRLKGTETYVRIECCDKYGKKAWTNPCYINR